VEEKRDGTPLTEILRSWRSLGQIRTSLSPHHTPHNECRSNATGRHPPLAKGRQRASGYAGDPAYSTWVDQVGDGVAPFETTVHLDHLDHVDNMDDAAKLLYLDDVPGYRFSTKG